MAKLFDMLSTDERSGKRKEDLVDLCASLISEAQSAKAVMPSLETLRDPTPLLERLA